MTQCIQSLWVLDSEDLTLRRVILRQVSVGVHIYGSWCLCDWVRLSYYTPPPTGVQRPESLSPWVPFLQNFPYLVGAVHMSPDLYLQNRRNKSSILNLPWLSEFSLPPRPAPELWVLWLITYLLILRQSRAGLELLIFLSLSTLVLGSYVCAIVADWHGVWLLIGQK